jgi:hypothetical protein
VTAAGCEATAAAARAVRRGRQPVQDGELLARFPPRVVPVTWAHTVMARDQAWDVLTAPPLARAGGPERSRRRGMRLMLDWLEDQDGGTSLSCVTGTRSRRACGT